MNNSDLQEEKCLIKEMKAEIVSNWTMKIVIYKQKIL